MIHIPRNDLKSPAMPAIRAKVLSAASWTSDAKYTLMDDCFCAHSATLETVVSIELLTTTRDGITAATAAQRTAWIATGQVDEVTAADGSYTFKVLGTKPTVDIPVLVTVSRAAK